ncbi:hypothetical protein L2E82_15055 [Cichorium intybus]|uniref:Uncharacterized protein n=1 Tax=Cichorium intybus TaxID=13427 RepID=A0ACB9F1R5_CICIN|nr:hypothetical protein L2E82_15055 [Cichorium intybus]
MAATLFLLMGVLPLSLARGHDYDAGDNVKFGLPMAFTVTMMSSSIMEYGNHMGASGELSHAMEAGKWGTDYLIKAHPEPHVLYGEVPNTFVNASIQQFVIQDP